MVGMLIVSHTILSKAFKKTIEMIIGPKEFVEYVGFYEGETPEFLKKNMLEKIECLEQKGYEEIIIFADLFGGTPCNQAVTLLKEMNLQIIVGINLPMLLESCLSNDNKTGENLGKMALVNGMNGMFNATEFLKNREEDGK